MGKQIIRLTESDLHQMVKEAVNKILKESMNEVQFGGESLHGNNPEDWAAAMHMRDANVNRDERLAKNRFYKNNNSASLSGIHNREQGLKDLKNMVQTNHNTLEPFGAASDKGREKAKRIIANRNKEEMNKQFGSGW